ncbi:hypothetical protein POTOM_027759 [Populus tomentosa]|uniref:Uncharacterized protein n=1 Tax=Populus tomentosa TaxID=118781 RepID=A0A8X8CXH4_POPTO|nr:hypothetical protein POTOM_027759 [Populus tomentosa]
MEPPTPDVLEWLQKVDVPTIVAVVVIGLLLRSCYRCLTKKNGLEVVPTQVGFFLSQHKYAYDVLSTTNMSGAKDVSTPISTSHSLQLVMALLLWTAEMIISYSRYMTIDIDATKGLHLKDDCAILKLALEEDNESVNENDADLNKSLNKQRRHAVAAAPGEQRRSIASRSTYKDKGRGCQLSCLRQYYNEEIIFPNFAVRNNSEKRSERKALSISMMKRHEWKEAEGKLLILFSVSRS